VAVSAQIYWYPETDGPLRILDLIRDWRELTHADPADFVSARNADGQRILTTYLSMRTVRAAIEYVDDRAVVRELQAIEGHLRRNGTIGIAERDGSAWGGFATELPEQGATEVRITENLWAAWGSAADLDAGDTIIVQGPSPVGRWEECVIASVSANRRRITLAEGLRYDYSAGDWCLVRDSRFWPIVRSQDAAINTPILRTDHRITWALDLQLEEPPHRIARAAELNEPYRGTTGPILSGASYEIEEDRAVYTGGLVRL
jgi:hypothetical protein